MIFSEVCLKHNQKRSRSNPRSTDWRNEFINKSYHIVISISSVHFEILSIDRCYYKAREKKNLVLHFLNYLLFSFPSRSRFSHSSFKIPWFAEEKKSFLNSTDLRIRFANFRITFDCLKSRSLRDFYFFVQRVKHFLSADENAKHYYYY